MPTTSLIAPWVGSLQLRDLRAPDTAARDLAEQDGVTPFVPRPPASGCGGSWPVLQLRSSPRVAEHHAFLLTDLDRVVATHLTYQPPPQAGPAQSPREATGSAALVLWSRLACTLPALRGADVKAVNAWEFAVQPLPGTAGSAAWVCTRADHWDGAGSAGTVFLAPGARGATLTGSEPDGRSCSRFEQNVVAQVRWTPSPGAPSYLLAAGSRRVRRITPPGGPSSDVAAQHVLTVPWTRSGPVQAVLDDGTVIRPLPAQR